MLNKRKKQSTSNTVSNAPISSSFIIPQVILGDKLTESDQIFLGFVYFVFDSNFELQPGNPDFVML